MAYRFSSEIGEGFYESLGARLGFPGPSAADNHLTVRRKYQKIAIRMPNWLGDLMMSTVFVQAVMDRFPQAEIDLIVKKGLERIPLPRRGKILPFDKGSETLFLFGRRLRKERYDAIFLLPPSFSSALMAFWARIPVRIGYAQNGRSLFLRPSIPYRREHRSQHLIQEYLQLLGGDHVAKDHLPHLPIENGWSDRILAPYRERFPQFPEKYVTLAPGSAYGAAKQWPVAYYRKVATLLQEWSVHFVVAGTQDDFALGEEIAKGLDRGINLCGQTGLLELIAVLEQSSLLVSNDSGAMHVMAALRKSQIALFGSTSTTWTAPVNPKAAILQEPTACSPCFKRECRYGHYDCLRKLEPGRVTGQIRTILKIE